MDKFLNNGEKSNMKHILFDCDNTMGMEGRPMDDGLALLYLAGCRDEAEIAGIACNFGNGTAAETYSCTRELLQEAGLNYIPLYKGSEKGEDPRSEAAELIVKAADQHKGKLQYLGIGSLGNLYGAYLIDPDIFSKIDRIVLMGGITEPLYIHGSTPLHELNFSINSEASCYVLTYGKNISIITGNNCLPVSELPKDEFMDKMCLNDNPSGMYIAQKCGYRFHDKEVIYGADSSYFWDGVAAAYLLHPDMFTDHPTPCRINPEDMESGFLHPTDEEQANCVLNLPQAKNRRTFQNTFYEGWLNLNINTPDKNFSCNGVYLDRLLQPSILIELSKAPAHGFLLMQKLKNDGLIDNSLDPAGFYRRLKKLEQDNCLTSVIDRTSGKPKRVFSITDFGRRTLLAWERTLENYDQHIQLILQEIEKVK